MTAHVTTVSYAEGTAPVGATAAVEIYIKAVPERIWEDITDPAVRAKFSFGSKPSRTGQLARPTARVCPGSSPSPRA